MSKIATVALGSSPSIPTSFTPDVGVTVIPAANNVDFFQDEAIIQYNALSDQGIETISLFPSDDREVLRVGLFGNLTRAATTIGGFSEDIASIQLENSPQVVYFYGNVQAISNDLGGGGAGFGFSVCALTNGIITDIVGVSVTDNFTDPALLGISFTATTTGVDNFLTFVVTGIPAAVIDWRITIYYRFAE